MGAFDDLIPSAGPAGAFDDLIPKKPTATAATRPGVAADILRNGLPWLAEGTNNILGAIPDLVAPEGRVAGFFKDNAEYWREKQSDDLIARQKAADERINAAGQDGVMSQAGAAVGEYVDDPALAARLAVTNIPSFIPGLGLGKAAQVAGAARGLSAAQQVALATGVAAGTNSALNAGGARGDAFGDIKKSLMAKGVSEADATELALEGSKLPAAVGAATGYLSGKIGLEKALLGKVGPGSALKRAAGSFGAEMGGEQLEEVLPKVATNLAVQQVDPTRGLTSDLGRTMVDTAAGAGPTSIASAGTTGYRAMRGEQPAAPPADLTAATPADEILGGAETTPAAGTTPGGTVNPAAEPTAAETALLTPRALTSLDRVDAIDRELAAAPADAPTTQALRDERATLTRDWPVTVPGKDDTFTTEAGARVAARYSLVDADSLVTSHDEQLRPSPAYPPELQPRERDRAASEMQVQSITSKLDPARLGLSADAANGAPIIGADGLVESGNARTIALKRVYRARGQKAEDYKGWLRANAGAFGLTPEAVDGMAKPVLVRVRTTPVNRAEFARQANASTVAAMSPAEQARSDANRIDAMDDLRPTEDGEFSTSRDFIRRFMSRLPATEQAGMMDATGQLSSAGYARVRNAVLAKAYGDSPVLARMVESMDDTQRNLSKALMMAAPRVAQTRAAIGEGSLFDADITPHLVEAVEILARLKADGVSLADAMAQTGMFGDGWSAETRDLLQFLSDNTRRPRKIAEFLTAYADALDAAGNPAQGSMFGETAPPATGDLMAAARRTTEGPTDGIPTEDTQRRAPAAPAQGGKDRAGQPEDAQGNRRGPEGNGAAPTAASAGPREARSGWVSFGPETGTLGIPRADMPQIRAEHRGALVQFLAARGIERSAETVEADTLRPTQAEYSPRKVRAAAEFEGGDRSILVSADGHVLDGHHQWLAKRDAGESVNVLRLDAPIQDLLRLAHQFPSSTTASGGARASARGASAVADAAVVAERFPAVATIVGMSVGPGGRITPTPIAAGRPLYRETNLAGLDDLLRLDGQADLMGVFVTDNPDLALGQGVNRGVMVTFRPDSLSGREHKKPMTGDIAGREYKTDLRAPHAVRTIEMVDADISKLRGLTRRALKDFVREPMEGGRVRLHRRGLQGTAAASIEARHADAVARVKAALGDVVDILSAHTRATMLQEDHPGLMPALVRLFDAAIDIVGTDLVRATAWVRDQLKSEPRTRAVWNRVATETYRKAAQQALAQRQGRDADQGGLFGADELPVLADAPAAPSAQRDLYAPDQGAAAAATKTPAGSGDAATSPRAEAVPVKGAAGRPAAAAAAGPSSIEDAGEKIGGARKDLWKERGLMAADLDAMTEAEGATLVNKANVWKPDYAAMAADIGEPVTVALVKVIYDSLAAKPKANTPQGRRDYVSAMQAVRQVYGAARSLDEVKDGYLKLREALGVRSSRGMDSFRPTSDQKDAQRVLFSVYKGRSDPFVLGYNELARARKLVVDGFPGAVEPWTRRFALSRAGGAGSTDNGTAAIVKQAQGLGTPVTVEQARAGVFLVIGKANRKAVAMAATRADAEAAAKAVYERERATDGPTRAEPERPHLDKIGRAGLPVAMDRDATANDMLEAFGFRGVEFGNWAAQDERQKILNLAFDAMADLARIMNVPQRAISLNGTMGLAFGARGGGRSAAHYEPGKLVINMTKLRGAGSLAHEWAHAFDHYLGELDRADAYQSTARGASGWLSEARYDGKPTKRMVKGADGVWTPTEQMRMANLRPELATRVDAVMRRLFNTPIPHDEAVAIQRAEVQRTETYLTTEQDPVVRKAYEDGLKVRRAVLDGLLAGQPSERMKRSSFASEAQKLSGKSTSGYWTRPTEMFARAFESYVFDRLMAMGARSDYLVHGVESDRFADGTRYKGNPYPTGDERAAINTELDKLVGELKTRPSADGNVAILSRAPTTKMPAFKAWFGRSVVVNDDGTPKVMYHGTGADITAFRAQQAGAIFVTDEPFFAQAYADTSAKWMRDRGWDGAANIVPAYVKAERPFDYENPEHVDAVVAAMGVSVADDADALAENLRSGNWDVIEQPDAQEAIKSLGFDAFYVEESGFKNLAVYEPTQLKSAIGNRGTFDPSTPDLRLSDTRGAAGGGAGVSVKAVQAVADRVAQALPGLPKVQVLKSPRDLAESGSTGQLRTAIEQRGAMDDAEGALHDGVIYLFTDHLADEVRAEHVLAEHEAAHAGLRGLLGDALPRAMQSIANQNAQVRSAAVVLMKADPALSMIEAIEEVIVDMPSSALAKLKGWRGLVDRVRGWLSRHGFERLAAQVDGWIAGSLSEQDRAALFVADLVREARAFVGRKAGAQPGGPVLSRAATAGAAPAQTPTERAEAMIQASAGTPKPIDAAARLLTSVSGIDKAAGWMYGAGARLLDRLTPERLKAGLVSDYGVPEAVIDQRAMMQGRQRQQLRGAGALLEKLSTLTRAESRVAYEWMNMDGSDPKAYVSMMHGLPEESVLVLQEVQRLIDKLSQEAVRLGQLDAESFKRHRFAYLRRSYVKHTAELTAGDKAKRQRAITILGDQYKGRGMVDKAPMSQIKNTAPEWWQRKFVAGKADTSLKGEKFVRLERRTIEVNGREVRHYKAHTKPVGSDKSVMLDTRTPDLAGVESATQRTKLREVAYVPAGQKIPPAYADWDNAGTWEARDVKGGDVVMWRDFTADEREKMGEIDEARFAIAKTLHGMIHDIEVGKYLEWLATTQAKKDGEAIDGTIVDPSERYLDTFKPGEWVQVPETKIPGTSVMKYGKLAGRFIPGPVWNDLRQVVGGRFQPLGETYATILSAWKTSKTALSPGVHTNNVMSNFVMADWHDVSAGHVAKALRIILGASKRDGKGALGRVGNVMARGGVSDAEAAREVLARYEDSGGAIGGWVTQEIRNEQLAPLIEAMQKELAGAAAGTVGAEVGIYSALQHLMHGRFPAAFELLKASKPVTAVRTEGSTLIDLYQAEDDVFRLAAWLKAKEGGMSDAEAGKAARRSFLDYSINAPWVQALRSTALPFVSFTYRAVPMLLETAGKKPHKLLKLMAVVGTLNALGLLLAGGGGGDDERKLLPEEKAGGVWGLVPKLVRMPWNDANGSPVYLDIRRWIPVGDVLDLGQGHAALPIPPAMMPGGPLALLGELVLNRSAFTGKPVTLETDTATEKAGKVVDYLWKAFAPNVLGVPGTYATQGVADAVKGRTDAFGREMSVAQAMASSVGVKIGSYPADVLRRNLQAQANAKIAEIDRVISDLKRQRQTNRIGDEEFADKVRTQKAKEMDVRRELAEKVN